MTWENAAPWKHRPAKQQHLDHAVSACDQHTKSGEQPPGATAPYLQATINCQPACKPGSVWPLRLPARTRRPFLWDIRCRMPRCDPPGQLARKPAWQGCPRRVVPIRSCSRWGLPCRGRCRRTRWALAPPFHPCRGKPRRSVFCGTFPRVARLPASPAGSYPASLFHGARTFLQRAPFGDCVSGHPAGWQAAHSHLSWESSRKRRTRSWKCRRAGAA